MPPKGFLNRTRLQFELQWKVNSLYCNSLGTSIEEALRATLVFLVEYGSRPPIDFASGISAFLQHISEKILLLPVVSFLETDGLNRFSFW